MKSLRALLPLTSLVLLGGLYLTGCDGAQTLEGGEPPDTPLPPAEYAADSARVDAVAAPEASWEGVGER
jgi:hypothetical protein